MKPVTQARLPCRTQGITEPTPIQRPTGPVQTSSPLREPSRYNLRLPQIQQPQIETETIENNVQQVYQAFVPEIPEGFTRQLTDLGKLYLDSDKKFGRELFDILYLKLRI